MTTPRFVILLLSGGMDSVVLLYWLQAQGCRVHCVLFDYGQRHQNELCYAKRHCERLNIQFTIISIATLGGSELTDGKGTFVVPNRNAVMLSYAINLAVQAKADSVAYACNADDAENFPDCRPEFVAAMNAAAKAAELPVEICAPFIEMRKWAIADTGRQLGVNMDDTWSCYRGGVEPCGECPACEKRHIAMHGHSKQQCGCSKWK